MHEADESGLMRAQGLLDSLAQYQARFVTPIIGSQNGRRQLVGSGVLIRFNEMTCVASAAHVLEHEEIAAESFIYGGKIFSLPKHRCVTEFPKSGSRDDDSVDLGCWILPADLADSIGKDDCVTTDSFDSPSEPHRDDDQHLLQGYPTNRNRRRLEAEGQQTLTIWSLLASEMAASAYVDRSLSQTDSLFLDFTKADSWRDGKRFVATDPYGASGGPIWRLSSATSEPLLAAIAIGWKASGRTKGIVGTRVFHLQRLLATAK